MDSIALQEKIRLAARHISASNAIAVTGAGISASSGIPTFRGMSGLWNQYDPMQYAQIKSFMANPEKSWEFFQNVYALVKDSKPNQAHYALARLQQLGLLSGVITQNIDNLHFAAGQQTLIEIHGNFRTLKCMACNNEIDSEGLAFLPDMPPPRCKCGKILKPNVILFGELISSELFLDAFLMIQNAASLLLIGTSGAVYPVNQFPFMASKRDIPIIELNTEMTEFTSKFNTLFIQGEVEITLPAILREIEASPSFGRMKPSL